MVLRDLRMFRILFLLFNSHEIKSQGWKYHKIKLHEKLTSLNPKRIMTIIYCLHM